MCYSASVKLPGAHIPPSVQGMTGTKQTLSEHCNPTFRRFLALGNRIAHSTAGGGGVKEGKKRKQSPETHCFLKCSLTLIGPTVNRH